MNELGEDKIKCFINSFCCPQDLDIEIFLRDRAVKFETLQKARTYLIFDEEQLADDSVDISDLIVYGYFSLALKVLSIPDDVSNRTRKELDGFSAKIHGEIITDIPCYLIGQLARNSEVEKSKLSGKQILDFALSIILDAVEAVGGRIIMIECHDDEKLISFYQDNGFAVVSELPDNSMKMKQMIRKIS